MPRTFKIEGRLRPWFAALAVSASTAGMAITGDSAFGKSATWTTTLNDTGAAATDCANCEENISVLVSCTRGNPEREIHLMILEQRDDGLAGQKALVRITSGKDAVALSGTYSNPGLIGPYPIVRLDRRDTALEFLASADVIKLSAGDGVSVVNMTGSRKALNKLDTACR